MTAFVNWIREKAVMQYGSHFWLFDYCYYLRMLFDMLYLPDVCIYYGAFKWRIQKRALEIDMIYNRDSREYFYGGCWHKTKHISVENAMNGRLTPFNIGKKKLCYSYVWCSISNRWDLHCHGNYKWYTSRLFLKATRNPVLCTSKISTISQFHTCAIFKWIEGNLLNIWHVTKLLQFKYKMDAEIKLVVIQNKFYFKIGVILGIPLFLFFHKRRHSNWI